MTSPDLAMPNPLAHPTLRDADLCHVLADGADLGSGRCMCGAVVEAEPLCCDPPRAPRCGRPRCPECLMLFRDSRGRGRPD